MKKSAGYIWLVGLVPVVALCGLSWLCNPSIRVYGADVIDDPYQQIRVRCQSQIEEKYWSVCCQPPDYWNNTTCPYQKKSQALESDNSADTSGIPPRQFGTAEENNAYRSMLNCFSGGGNPAACRETLKQQGMADFVARNPECLAAYQESEAQGQAEFPESCKGPAAAWGERIGKAGQLAYEDWQAARKKNETPLKSLANTFSGILPQQQEDAEARQRFDAMEQQATALPAREIPGAGNTTVGTNTPGNSGKTTPVPVTAGYGVANVKEGQVVKAEVPEGSLLSKVVLTSGQNIGDGTLSIEISDSATPQFLRAEEDVPPPDPRIWKRLNYLRVSSTDNQKDTRPWSQAMFEFFLPLTPDVVQPDAAMLRWNRDRKAWDSLPTSQIGCSRTSCRFVAVSPGTSIFAITIKKTPVKLQYIFASLAFWGSILYFFVSWLKSRGKKNPVQRKNQICRFCRSAIDSRAVRCPRCTADLRIWPKRHPIMAVVLATVLAATVGAVMDTVPGAGAYLAIAGAVVILFAGIKSRLSSVKTA